MAIGLLHHLDDHAVAKLARFTARMLSPNGRFVSIDPAFVEGQNPIGRWLAARDSGENVRAPDAYQALSSLLLKRRR